MVDLAAILTEKLVNVHAKATLSSKIMSLVGVVVTLRWGITHKGVVVKLRAGVEGAVLELRIKLESKLGVSGIISVPSKSGEKSRARNSITTTQIDLWIDLKVHSTVSEL